MKQAFTIIELIVTIAIIAIVTAIIVPVLTRSRVSAYNVNHASNLKQIGIARQLYSDQSDISTYSTVPIVKADQLNIALLIGKWDPFTIGAANQNRSYSTGEYKTTKYFDSVLVLPMYVGKQFFDEFNTSNGGGWALIQSSPTTTKEGRILSKDTEWFTGEYLRLRFDGGITHRIINFEAYVDANGLLQSGFQPYKCFTDDIIPKLDHPLGKD